MNSLKSIRNFLLILLALPAVSCCLFAQTTPAVPVGGTTINGLQLSLSLDTSAVLPSHAPALTLGLRNAGTNELHVLLGGGCGLPQYANAVDIILLDSSGAPKRLKSFENSVCAGVGGTFFKSLSPGASFSTPIRLDRYACLSSCGTYTRWEPGATYTVQAELISEHDDRPPMPPNVRYWPYWEGTVKSNQLQIRFPAEYAHAASAFY
jgi:hypothetical protein